MKTPFQQLRMVGSKVLRLLIFFICIAACNDDDKVVPEIVCSTADIMKPYGTDDPHFNLNIYLTGEKTATCGYIEFRQVADNGQFIHLDTWVHHLKPNTNYILQRAVDTTIDENCTSTAWLTLGKGLNAQSILTNEKGDGYAELYRSVSMIAVGTTFDIHFQILEESNSTVALTSSCYRYTVR
jgi:hypothetical protein